MRIIIAVVAAIFASIFSCKMQEKKLKQQLMKHKEAIEEAERKAMNKGKALATASHDVRAALAGIAGLVKMSYRDVAPGSDLETNLKQIDSCANDLLDLLNSILDASKIEAGKMQLEEADFDIEKLLEDVADLYHPAGMKKGVDVILDPCDGSLIRHSIVNGDRLKLKQIMCNLLSNAVKFTDEGHVSIRACARTPMVDNTPIDGSKKRNSNSWFSSLFCSSSKKAHLELHEPKPVAKHDPDSMEYLFEIDDTGKGIPEHERKNVFENFVQVKENSAGVCGTGLGLGIVRSLVRLMGGDIEIVDKAFDERGACFKFSVILTNRNNNAELLSKHECTALTHAHSVVVLLIQNEGRRKMIQRFLESLGVMVVVASEARVIPSIVKGTIYSVPGCAVQVPISFFLLIIDANAGEFSELKDCVVNSRRELSGRSSCKVVWLGTAEFKNYNGSKEKEGFPLADYVTSKPLHGSRLYEVIKLLPEFGGESVFSCAKRVSDTQMGVSTVLDQDMGDQRVVSKISMSETCPKDCERGETYPKQEVVSMDGVSDLKSPLDGKRVLIAEDNKLLMLVAVRVVTKMGGIVEKCSNGKEAVELVRKGLADKPLSGSLEPPFHYILMDSEMPVMNGCEATKMIREEEIKYGFHTPIISVSAHGDKKELERMSEAGMDHHLQKPLDEGKLREAIRSIKAG